MLKPPQTAVTGKIGHIRMFGDASCGRLARMVRSCGPGSLMCPRLLGCRSSTCLPDNVSKRCHKTEDVIHHIPFHLRGQVQSCIQKPVPLIIHLTSLRTWFFARPQPLSKSSACAPLFSSISGCAAIATRPVPVGHTGSRVSVPFSWRCPCPKCWWWALWIAWTPLWRQPTCRAASAWSLGASKEAANDPPRLAMKFKSQQEQ